MLLKLSISTLVILLTGCATYKHPAASIIGDNKVKLTINSPQLLEKEKLLDFKNFTNSVEVDVYHGGNGCPWSGEIDSKESYLFTTKINRTEPTKTVDIPTGEQYKDIYLAINDANGATICPQNVLFQVKSNQDYELTVQAHLNPMSRCTATIKAKNINGEETIVPIKQTAPTSMFMGLYGYEAICKVQP
jgi:hypothetical protein